MPPEVGLCVSLVSKFRTVVPRGCAFQKSRVPIPVRPWAGIGKGVRYAGIRSRSSPSRAPSESPCRPCPRRRRTVSRRRSSDVPLPAELLQVQGRVRDRSRSHHPRPVPRWQQRGRVHAGQHHPQPEEHRLRGGGGWTSTSASAGGPSGSA